MYLIDTNVISEIRKRERADAGVRAFFDAAARDAAELYLSVITVGELQRGVDRIRRRGDAPQADRLQAWLDLVLDAYARHVLPLDLDTGRAWGRLRAHRPDEHPLDAFIAATALIHDLTVVTRNTADFSGTGARVLNPFAA